MIVKSLKCLSILFPCTMLHDRMITWHMMLTWYRTPALICLHLTPDPRHLISDTGTWHVILDTWYLTHDIWHRYLTCYYLTPEVWHRYLTCYTWHLILDTWYLTLALGMLYLTPDIWYMTLDTWHAITWYWHIWPNIVTPERILSLDTCILYIFMIITFTRTWHGY